LCFHVVKHISIQNAFFIVRYHSLVRINDASAGIPVRLKNTLDPKADGTIIDNVIVRGKIKAVAAKDNITAIKIKSSRMLLATGFLRKVFEIFESYQTPIDMIATSEVGVSMSIDNDAHLNDIVNELKKYEVKK
jgi:aspartate kinase